MSNPVAILVKVDNQGVHYPAIVFVCPGCVAMIGEYTGLHLLPVNTTEHSPSWDFDGNLEAPTLSPSIKTDYGQGENSPLICHSFLKAGIWEFLGDSTHSLAGQSVPMVPLEDWMLNE